MEPIENRRPPVVLSYFSSSNEFLDRKGVPFTPQLGDQIEGDNSDRGWREILAKRGYQVTPVPHSGNWKISSQNTSKPIK